MQGGGGVFNVSKLSENTVASYSNVKSVYIYRQSGENQSPKNTLKEVMHSYFTS